MIFVLPVTLYDDVSEQVEIMISNCPVLSKSTAQIPWFAPAAQVGLVKTTVPVADWASAGSMNMSASDDAWCGFRAPVKTLASKPIKSSTVTTKRVGLIYFDFGIVVSID